MKRWFCISVFLLLAAMLLWSGTKPLRERYRAEREREANLLLAEEVRQAGERQNALSAPSDQPAEEETGRIPEKEETAEPVQEPAILPQYETPWNRNKDLAGWLTIEDLGIDYAVMYTPQEPEYYLHRGFDGEETEGGSLFIGEGWEPEGGNTIIYGHHMKDGTMFGKLGRYGSESYAREHPLIRYDTLTQEGEYQVIAAFYSRIYSLKDQDVFRYYWYSDLRQEERFAEYMAGVKEASLYDTGVEAVYGDELLTLSTCSYHTRMGRFVVVARKVQSHKFESQS